MISLSGNNKGFTLLEVTSMVVVIAILTTATFVTFGKVREKNRDTMRVTHITQLQNSLASYRRDAGAYPEYLTPGAILTYNSTEYMDIPSNILPIDGDCTNDSYAYTQDNSGTSYHLAFCLGRQTSDIPAGINTATPAGIADGGNFIDGHTKLLLHFDNNITDSSSNSYTVTNNGVSFATSPVKFETHSGSFNGTSDYLSIPDSADWDFGAGDFTIDFWVKHIALTGNPVFIGQVNDITNYWKIQYVASSDRGLEFSFRDDATNITASQASITGWDTNWHHIAIVRKETSYIAYLDGVNVANTTDSNNPQNLTGSVVLGRMNFLTPSDYFNGYIDELRISKGIARWTSAFTPPTAAY